jgi:hypothetical protein
MAFVDYSLNFPPEDKVDYPWIYNVSYGIGYVGVNSRDDVMLVQYLLKKIWERVKGAMPPAGNMVVDGWMGPTTDRWIRDYQSGRVFDPPQPSLMVHDGIVDRAMGGEDTPIQHRTWTIIMLNVGFKKKYPELYYTLPAAPDLPPLLASSLAQGMPWLGG